MIEFTVPDVPIAQPRHKHSHINGMSRSYIKADHPVHAFKAACKIKAREAYDGAPLQGPLKVSLVFVMPRPQAMFWKTKPMPREFHAKKPDCDNLMKSIMDSLNGLLWHDDSQICDGTISKFIASGDEQAHVTISVNQL